MREAVSKVCWDEKHGIVRNKSQGDSDEGDTNDVSFTKQQGVISIQ